jgi:CubicO group peptidase (beta-lactamase class C family)
MNTVLGMSRWLILLTVAAALAATMPLRAQPAASLEPQVDRIFERWTNATPGCAVGVAVRGMPVLTKAYGMADLEHDVPNTPDTIFEAGSVSKQFTAAAVLLLARDGQLSLDDPVRKYIPELPEYGRPLLIRHMLTHSGGLRDWGNVASIGGWPRTSRVYTHAHVLEIVSHQRSLNFLPGDHYSYSNTGYNLAAIIVSRVSGMSFADFTRTRIFEPLGMTRTSWRDDYARIVKGRAMSYNADGGGFRTVMPFENAHGNGGLLTTVGDLLKWNENFVSPKVGDAAMRDEQQRTRPLTNGRMQSYALGLEVGSRRGVREVAHSGSTAGYRAHLARYPDAGVSVAVLCNASSAAATTYLGSVADLYLADRLQPEAARATYTLSAHEADALAGIYRNSKTGAAATIARGESGLRLGPVSLYATSATRLVTGSGTALEWSGRDRVTVSDTEGNVDALVRTADASPDATQLAELAGVYVSDEAETTLIAAVDGTGLVLKRRPDTVIRLTPLYADAFTGSIGTVIFRREGGRVTALSIVQDRVWDLRFTRRADAQKPTVQRQ